MCSHNKMHSSDDMGKFVKFSHTATFSLDGIEELNFGSRRNHEPFVVTFNGLHFTPHVRIYPNGVKSSENKIYQGFLAAIVMACPTDQHIDFFTRYSIETVQGTTAALGEACMFTSTKDTRNWGWFSTSHSLGPNIAALREKGYVLPGNVIRLFLELKIAHSAFEFKPALDEQISALSRDPGHTIRALYEDLVDEEDVYADYTLVDAEESQYPCHRNVIGKRSPFFQCLFRTDGNSQKKSERLCLSRPLMEELIHFLYNDSVTHHFSSLLAANPDQVLNMAKMYMLTKLEKICEEELVRNVKIENAWDLLELSHRFDLKYLKNRALVYVSDDPEMPKKLRKLDNEELEEKETFSSELRCRNLGAWTAKGCIAGVNGCLRSPDPVMPGRTRGPMGQNEKETQTDPTAGSDSSSESSSSKSSETSGSSSSSGSKAVNEKKKEVVVKKINSVEPKDKSAAENAEKSKEVATESNEKTAKSKQADNSGSEAKPEEKAGSGDESETGSGTEDADTTRGSESLEGSENDTKTKLNPPSGNDKPEAGSEAAAQKDIEKIEEAKKELEATTPTPTPAPTEPPTEPPTVAPTEAPKAPEKESEGLDEKKETEEVKKVVGPSDDFVPAPPSGY